MIPGLMILQSIALVFLGAGLGGVVRYLLSLALNPLFTALPLGTLTSNLSGCYVAGIVAGAFALRADLDPALRIVLVTGFLGGLTTFSSFALEVTQMLEAGKTLGAGGVIAAHVVGSIAAALFGLATVRYALS
jgi:fluoride exporter